MHVFGCKLKMSPAPFLRRLEHISLAMKENSLLFLGPESIPPANQRASQATWITAATSPLSVPCGWEEEFARRKGRLVVSKEREDLGSLWLLPLSR